MNLYAHIPQIFEMAIKTQTRQLLELVMPECLAGIAEGYLMPKFGTSSHIGLSGYGELYFQIKDYEAGLQGACMGGYIELAQMLIGLGARNFNYGLSSACEGGHDELIQLMIANGANDFNCGLWGACEGGNISIAKQMISYGADDWDGGLYYACMYKHFELAQLMIDCGATGTCEWCGHSTDIHSKYRFNSPK